MRVRRFFAMLLVSFGVASSSARGVEVNPTAVGEGLPSTFDLKQQLEKGLKARRPSDFAFIAGVVTKVELGVLPRSMIDQALLYARNRSRDYPFIYFEFALRKQAKKFGVTL